MEAVGSGNLDHSIGLSTRDELGELARSFDRMTVTLKEVTASKADLEKEIVERKRAEETLSRLNEELEESNKQLESFSYSVSHDLREPLRAISGFTGILNEDYRSKLDIEGKKIIDTILSGTERMGRLINDLLAFSRAGRQAIAGTDIDMYKLTEKIVEELKSETNGRSLDINIRPMASAYGDPNLIRQVMTNLIANAIKFTRTRDKAILEIGGGENERENIYFIKDNGVGFNPEFADKLFGVFQRLHTKEQFEGTGVGLAIVHRIVLRHGGRVWAESEPDKGAIFYFSLPIIKK